MAKEQVGQVFQPNAPSQHEIIFGCIVISTDLCGKQRKKSAEKGRHAGIGMLAGGGRESC